MMRPLLFTIAILIVGATTPSYVELLECLNMARDSRDLERGRPR
jgi:hypothetical protein